MILACQEPRGAWMSTVWPTRLPSTALPSGEEGETVPAPPKGGELDFDSLTVFVLDHETRAYGDDACGGGSHDLRLVEPVAEDRDPPLEQSLLVLCRVVLEVLGKVAVAASHPDRLDDLVAFRPLELREFGHESRVLLAGHIFAHGSTESYVVLCLVWPYPRSGGTL
jgi:hypothetical protein